MEVGTFRAVTPEPGNSSIRTPPAPLHGNTDSWEPYSPRKSSRISQRVANRNRTPSPSSTNRHSDNRTQSTDKRLQSTSFGSPKSKARRTTNMASPAFSPQKKRAPAVDSSRRASGALTFESTVTAAAALGLTNQIDLQPGRASISAVGGMLITPAKTPQKAPSEQTRAKIQAVARSLFSESDIMPSPKKARTSKYVLDSFSADDEVDQPIQIYTDSHDRVPEVDRSAENPFYGEHGPSTTPRRSKRQTVSIPGEGKVTVDEAVRREDGMVIVFRGKKQFRKFDSLEDGNGSNSEDLEMGTERGRRPLTRSAIKPRLLFPPKPEPKTETDDEEAATDIEDHVIVDQPEPENVPETPMEFDEQPGTPEAPKFAPASPPTTTRTTRFGAKKSLETTPMKSKDLRAPREATPKRRSPFDQWRRVKGGPSPSEGHGTKRQGEDITASPAKRTRA